MHTQVAHTAALIPFVTKYHGQGCSGLRFNQANASLADGIGGATFRLAWKTSGIPQVRGTPDVDYAPQMQIAATGVTQTTSGPL
jgi:hypothetical protein